MTVLCFDVRRNRLYSFTTMDASQKCANEKSVTCYMRRPANGQQFIRRPANARYGFDSLNCRVYWLLEATTYKVQCAGLEPLTNVPSERVFSTACGRYPPDWQKKSRITRQCLKTLGHKRKLAQILNSQNCLIILQTCSLEEMNVICCNCDFVYRPIVLQLQQKSDPAKSRSGRILGVGYPNPVCGRKSISVNPYHVRCKPFWSYASTFYFTIIRLLTDIWTRKYFQQCPLTWIFMWSFVEIPALSTETLRQVKLVLADNRKQRINGTLAKA